MSRTLRTGLIGNNISRSRIAEALNLLCHRDGWDHDFLPIDSTAVPEFNFAEHVTSMQNAGRDGVSIGDPFLKEADALAHTRSGYPAWIGASNILRFKGQGFTSFNTDYTGMVAAWKAKFGDTKPGHVAVSGAGDLARPMVAALMELGATGIEIWDEDPDLPEAMAQDIDPDHNTLIPTPIEASIPTILRADGVINCTRIGSIDQPGAAVHPLTLLGRTWAIETVLTPIETEFLQAARESGVACLSGFDLFKHMAAFSYAAYADRTVTAADISELELMAQDP